MRESLMEEQGFFFFPVSVTCRSSRVRDQTHATAVTRATAVTVLDL